MEIPVCPRDQGAATVAESPECRASYEDADPRHGKARIHTVEAPLAVSCGAIVDTTVAGASWAVGFAWVTNAGDLDRVRASSRSCGSLGWTPAS